MKKTYTHGSCLRIAGIVLVVLACTVGNNHSLMTALASATTLAETQTTLYGIGSTSKVITAAAVMKLAGEGTIDLDQTLVHYLPEFTMADDRYHLITIRMLLNHSSGLPGSTLTNSMLIQDPDTDNHDHLLERLRTQRLKADPGEFSVYCNDGFTLAELLIERVSGMSFTEYLEEEFATPLSLSHLKTPQSPANDIRLAATYDKQTGRELPPESPNVIGSGGIYATAEDLCKLSQIFMKDQGTSTGILPPQMASAMNISTYDLAMNPHGNDTNLSFGLGWDSVNSYPFSHYGIQALVKGGDTSYYHASLTVLPEENISCAVLSSGGSSGACQVAVQEILLSYLEEIKRIEREETTNQSTFETPIDFDTVSSYSGWYSGEGLTNVTIDEKGQLTLNTSGLGHDKTQTFSYGAENRFYSSDSGYVGMDGMLTKGSNGVIGHSALDFLTDSQGRTYLMAGTYETYPGLGNYASYFPVAQKLTEPSVDPGARQAWEKYNGKQFYLVSEKYSSAFYITRFMVQPWVSDEPDGYLTFENSALTIARITDTDQAKFFQQIPGHAGRDLSDYSIQKRNGNLYLNTASARYLCEDGIPPLPSQNTTISINADGDALWFSMDGSQNYHFVTIDAPINGAYYVYDATGKEPTCVASSYTFKSGEKFLLPEKGNIVFAGSPGQSFTLRFHW